MLGVLLGAGGLTAACEATGGSGCRPAAAVAEVQVAARPKPKKTTDRKPICTKATSDIWKGFTPYRGDIKTNGLSGSKLRFYQWDHTHGDIEVYDRRGGHLGSMDPASGSMTKPPEKGRRLGGVE